MAQKQTNEPQTTSIASQHWEQPTPETADLATVQSLAEGIHRIAEHMDNSRVQQVPFSKAKIITPWNPEGKKAHERVKLRRMTYQNGARLNEFVMTEGEISGWNRLKPGRYGPDRKWVVVKRNDGSIELRYPNKTIEERIEMKGIAKDIQSILNMVDAEYEARKAKRKAGIVEDDDVMND